MRKIVCIILICLLLAGCAGQNKAEKTVFAMDTVMHLTVWGKDREQALEELEALLLDMEKTYNAQSLNSGELTAQQQTLIRRAQEFCLRTDGAFDPQMYGIMQAWGFDTGEYTVPSGEELAQAPRLYDLGAAVKGFAGDEAVKLLKSMDVQCAMLNLGGNVQTYGTKPDGTPWTVGVRDPDGIKDYLGIISVEGTAAVVTSGDYQRYFEEDGVRYHHIMDPKTGRPADSGLRSVTVVCGDGLTADVMSTALFVMGMEKGSLYWQEQGGFEAVFVLTDGRIYATEGVNLTGCEYEVIKR